MKRRIAALAIVASSALTASPAAAHEEINPTSFPTGKPVFLTLSAANEDDADIVKIALTAPDGAAFGETTRSPQGWTAQATEETVTWSGGAVKPGQFESWGFEVEEATQPGELTYKVAISFAGGKTENAEVVVSVTAPGTAATTPAPGPEVTSTTTAVTETTQAEPEVGAGEPRVSKATDDSARSRANLAMAVGLAALALAVVGGFVRPRKRPKAAGPGPTAGQDW